MDQFFQSSGPSSGEFYEPPAPQQFEFGVFGQNQAESTSYSDFESLQAQSQFVADVHSVSLQEQAELERTKLIREKASAEAARKNELREKAAGWLSNWFQERSARLRDLQVSEQGRPEPGEGWQKVKKNLGEQVGSAKRMREAINSW